MISVTELQPATVPLTKQLVGLAVEPEIIERSQQRITTILQFFAALLGDRPYLTGNTFTLADIVAGTLVSSVPMFDITLANYPNLSDWVERLSQRKSFQQTAPTSEQIQSALPSIKKILATR